MTDQKKVRYQEPSIVMIRISKDDVICTSAIQFVDDGGYGDEVSWNDLFSSTPANPFSTWKN